MEVQYFYELFFSYFLTSKKSKPAKPSPAGEKFNISTKLSVARMQRHVAVAKVKP